MAGVGCGGNCLKFVLFFFNLIFWLAGAAILGVGIWLQVDPNAFHILRIIGDASDPFFNVAVYVLIGVGALIFLVGFLGCCGAISENRCMLITYGVLVGVLLVCQVVAGILALVFSNRINEEVQNEMVRQVQKEYVGEDSIDGVTRSWNFLQIHLKCCGATDFQDYIGSEFVRLNPSQPVPYTCCRMSDTGGDFPTPAPGDVTLCYEEARNDVQDAIYLYREGCYPQLKEWVRSKSIILMAVAFGVAGVQLFGIIFACVLQSAIASAKREDNKFV